MNTENMIQGTFEFGRWTGGGQDGFQLVVTDKSSGLVIFQAEVDPASLALAISGRGACPMMFIPPTQEILSRIGKVVTRRSVKLSITDSEIAHKIRKGFRSTQQEKDDFDHWAESAAMAAMRVEDGPKFKPDGWRLFASGRDSQQNFGWTVIMERYDDPQPPTETN